MRSRTPAARRHRAVSDAVLGLVAASFGIVLVFAAFSGRAQVAESSFTQANGVRERATVTRVHTVPSYSQYGCCAATYLTVTLPTPVRGRTSTVANLSYIADYISGQAVVVLVDPKDPGYAELPGRPYAVEFQFVVTGLLAAFMLVLGVAWTAGGVRTGLRRRRERGN